MRETRGADDEGEKNPGQPVCIPERCRSHMQVFPDDHVLHIRGGFYWPTNFTNFSKTITAIWVSFV